MSRGSQISLNWFLCGSSTLVELEFRDFVEGGKLENPEQNTRSKARTNKKLNRHMLGHVALQA